MITVILQTVRRIQQNQSQDLPSINIKMKIDTPRNARIKVMFVAKILLSLKADVI